MSSSTYESLVFLGCGNLGTPILQSVIRSYARDAAGPGPGPGPGRPKLPFRRITACVRTPASADRLKAALQQPSPEKVEVSIVAAGPEALAQAARAADAAILAVDPADVGALLAAPDLRAALEGKTLISVAAGWTAAQIRGALGQPDDEDGTTDHAAAGGAPGKRTIVLRTLPNIAAQASQSMTAIEQPPSPPPTASSTTEEHAAAALALTQSLFAEVGRTSLVQARHMDAFTAVGGSTPAFFAVAVEALADAAVAVGLPRAQALEAVVQSMAGTAALLQQGGGGSGSGGGTQHPALLKDQGTSSEGCTIAGLMVLEEGGFRGTLGRGLREAVTVARRMGTGDGHVNDTRH